MWMDEANAFYTKETSPQLGANYAGNIMQEVTQIHMHNGTTLTNREVTL